MSCGVESSSGHQNYVSIGPTVRKGIEWYLYPACIGSLDMLRYEEIKSPISTQEEALL
jgi:hypothetical protein